MVTATWALDRRLVAAVGGALLLAAFLGPARSVLELRGRPVEYSRLAAALDDLVVSGTPALVNGRSIVEYEMRPHPPARAVPTFTVPDAGFEQWRDNRWRETAEDFLRRFSDVPLVRQGRNYEDHPEVGLWAFPQTFFARRLVLHNRPAQRLAALDLAPVEDFYGSRTVTEISYNRPEDLLERAREEGRPFLGLWGDGWGYEKGPDLRDWRTLRAEAEVRVFNFTPDPQPAVLVLEVWAPARKRLMINGTLLEVPPSEGDQRLRLRQTLTPGESRILFEDHLYALGRAALYVTSMDVEQDEMELR